jgi:hypothetical protein
MVANDVVARRTPSVGGRLAVVLVATAALLALVAGFLVGFVFQFPKVGGEGVGFLDHPLTATAGQGGPGVSLHLETVASVDSAITFPRPNDPHPTWVSYLPTTTFKVPANTLVTMTIDQEDTPSGLRNPYWAKAQGIVGPFHMKYFDDTGAAQEGDFTKLDDASTLAHSFAIPDLGVFVPLQGLNASAPAGGMNVITFSFRTGKAGVYRWQCFVPCGAGTIYGNGGPMQTLGYMGGFLVVQ